MSTVSCGEDEKMPVLASGQANMNMNMRIELLECSLFAGPSSALRLTTLRQRVPEEADSVWL